MNWAEEEFADLDLGDKRLHKRLKKLAETFARQPTASIPAACEDWADTQGAYRFFAQDRIGWDDILAPHWKNTQARMAQHPVVLCLQDTTELDFNGQKINGLGRLNYDAQRGMYLHPTYAITPDREPLGVIDAYMWARAPKGEAGITESTRWIEGYERVAELAANMPNTRLVYVADREGDILELMKHAVSLNHPADWLIRARHDRNLANKKKLWTSVMSGEPVGEIGFTQGSRHGQKSRTIRQQIWVQRVSLTTGVEVTCVIAKEINAPSGVTPVQWRLLTNRRVVGLDGAKEIIEWYRARWEIELLFNIVKNACRIEALQLSTMERLERAIALYLVVAWRIARLMRLGRTCPDLPAELFFDPDEWKGAYVLSKKPVPKKPPKLNEVIRTIATLGGFLGRKSDGEPGMKTLWLGLQRVMDFATGMRFVRENGEM